MLLEPAPREPAKRVCLITHDPSFLAVLGALLEEWDYALLPRASSGCLILAEEGCPVPEQVGTLIRLGGSPCQARNRLSLPLVVEELWAALEPRFHKPPRNHMRIARQMQALARLRGAEEATTITSISDLGMRFILSRESVKDEVVELEFTIEGVSYRQFGRVIYVVPRGDAAGHAQNDIGILFTRPSAELRAAIRDYVVSCFLERVRVRFAAEIFCAGLDYFAISPAVRRRLGCQVSGE